MRHFRQIGFILGLSLALGVPTAKADVPHLIRYQGTVTDSVGIPLEGPYTLTFRIYDDESAGAELWKETQAGVTIAQGSFSVFLGSVSPLDLAFDRDVWLSIQVSSDPEMTPRIRLTSVPSAYRSEVAETAEQLSANLPESKITFDPSAGHTHAGLTSAPVQALMVLTNESGSNRSAGDVVVQDNVNDMAFTITTTVGDTRQVYVVQGGDIPIEGVGYVQGAGRVTLKVVGAVTRGHYLRTASTLGKAEDAGSSIVDGVFGRALESVEGAGPCLVDLFGVTFEIPVTEAEAVEGRIDNYVKNGSFDAYTTTAPDNWTRGGGVQGSGSWQDTGDGYFGPKSDKFVVNPGLTSTLTQTVVAITATKNLYFRGKTVSFEFYAKTTSGISNVAHAKARIDDGVGTTDSAEVTLDDVGGTWSRLRVTRTLDAAATKLDVVIVLRNSHATFTNSFREDGACLVGASESAPFAHHKDDAQNYD